MGQLEITKVNEKWQLVIPKNVRRELKLEKTDQILFTPHEKGFIISKLTEEVQLCPYCKGTGKCKTKERDSG